MRFYDEVMAHEAMMMQNKKESKIKLFAKSIVNKIRRLCDRLVNVLRDLAKVNPEFTKVVASGIALSAFWNTVDGTKELHGASYKVFKRLTDQVVSNVRRFYTNEVIVKKLLTGIVELGKVFFKLYASKKLFEFTRDSRSIYHTDGLKEIGDKIKNGLKSLIDKFRKNPKARKLVIYLSDIGVLTSAIIFKVLKYKEKIDVGELNELKQKLRKAELETASFIEKINDLRKRMGSNPMGEDTYDAILSDFKATVNEKEALIASYSAKKLFSLISLFISLVANIATRASGIKKDRLPIRHRHADFGEGIISQIRSMCRSFVGECRWLARKYPEAAGLLSAAISMSTFWDAVDGVRDIGNGFIKIFKRLFTKIERYEKYYTNEAIVGNFLRGIGRLAKAFFKLYASKKIIAFSEGY